MRAKVLKTYTYVVEGSKLGEFPLDMLRRDESQAATPADQALIDRLKSFGEDKADLPKTVRVTLVMTSERYPPLVARWESFGWKVIASNHPFSYGLPEKPPAVDAPKEPEPLNQRRAIKALADATVRLKPYVYMAAVVYAALREAHDVCEQDPEHRQHSIGYCGGIRDVLKTGKTASMLTGEDTQALIATLDVAIDLMTYQDTRYIQAFIGDRPKLAVSSLTALLKMHEAA